MALVGDHPAVASLSQGRITRGREAIRAELDGLAGSEVRFRYSAGAIEVEPLGPGHALASAPCSVTMISEAGEVERPIALTLVLEKSGGHWRLLHEHTSMRPQKAPGR